MLTQLIARIHLFSSLPIRRHNCNIFGRNYFCQRSLASNIIHWLCRIPEKQNYIWASIQREFHHDRNGQKRSSGSQESNGRGRHYPYILAFTFFGIFGWEDWKKLDDDPLKDKIKWAMLHRKNGRYGNAIEVLEEALRDAEELGNPKIITRILDEMANTYYEADDWEKASNLFRQVVHRLITIHRKTESSPEFIGISLKLADIFSRKGDPESADIGYKHCLSKQLQQADKAMSVYHVNHGGSMEMKSPVDEIGLDYTEPFALLGMCLHEYALFLMDYYADERLDEAEEYINEALRLSHKIYGLHAFHCMNILSTFASKCVLKNKFEIARKYLELGIDRLLLLPECESVADYTIALSYYCCYAEALFHTGDLEAAVDYANRAAKIAKDHPDSSVRHHVKNFSRQLQREALRLLQRGRKEEDKKGKLSWLWPF